MFLCHRVSPPPAHLPMTGDKANPGFCVLTSVNWPVPRIRFLNTQHRHLVRNRHLMRSRCFCHSLPVPCGVMSVQLGLEHGVCTAAPVEAAWDASAQGQGCHVRSCSYPLCVRCGLGSPRVVTISTENSFNRRQFLSTITPQLLEKQYILGHAVLRKPLPLSKLALSASSK